MSVTRAPDSGTLQGGSTHPLTPTQACVVYHASIIYSWTSMWPSQRLDASPTEEAEIVRSIARVLETAKDFVRTKRLHLRFVVLPLFLAGFAAREAEDKKLALELMRSFERASVTRNASTIRQLLQAVYQRQEQSLMQTGTPWTVDWTEVMKDSQLEVVNFGF